MEIKNKLTVTRGGMGRDNGGVKGEGSSRNMYKGHLSKVKERQDQGWEVRMAEVVGSGGGGEMAIIVLEKQLKRERRKIKYR